MNPRQFFTSHHWWGKFIGAILGYLIFGPSGAILGVLLGNLFDRSLTDHFTKPYWSYHSEKRKAIQKVFFEATFSVMGHLSKVDGRITEEQIIQANRLMDELQIGKLQRKTAQNYFRVGAKVDFDLWPILSLLKDVTKDNPELLKLFIDLQFKAALVGGLSVKKQQLLNTILSYMGFAPLHQQQRFYEDFVTRKTHRSAHNESNYSSSSSHQQPRNETDHAYGILGITRSTNKQDITRAYRRLMSRNHPDKLIAKGLPEAMIKVANEKTQIIRKAYEQICTEKGW